MGISPPRPGYIRVFAQTDGSPVGRAALEYTRSLLRVAPVRIISATPGSLCGPWTAYTALYSTPMVGSFVNVVAAPPHRWSWLASVPMSDSDVPAASAVAGTDEAEVTEHAQGRIELYTASALHNVLFALTDPATTVDSVALEAALKYQRIVVAVGEHALWWRANGARDVRVLELGPNPNDPRTMVDHRRVRDLIIPAQGQP